ncbi:MAG: HAMP domain-containing protein [Candidatus Omnitrophota bacterium]
MTALVFLFGLSTTLIIRTILLGVLRTEFQHKGLSSARTIAANSVMDILTQNTSRLKLLVENEKKLDPDTAYVFIIDASGRILTHTFEGGFPVDLINANVLTKNKDFNIQLLDTQRGFIYDIDVPILLDASIIGQVRLGVLQSGIQKTIALIDVTIAIVALSIIVVSMLLANKISALITDPISRLVKAVQLIKKGDFSTRLTVTSRDEIGFLADAFNSMAADLKQLIGQKEEFTKLEERKKIALDLHDNCAQDLANLIKRLEFCERLFKIEPIKAFEELAILRDNIREHLVKTRQIIYGFKGQGHEDFILLEEIREYIAQYERYTNIYVTLSVSESITADILADKSRNIYFIITEALTNVRKHANAHNVQIHLDNTSLNELNINIKDDGKGFNVREVESTASRLGKWGLMSMRERLSFLKGSMSINSTPGQGTEISVRIPLGTLEFEI